MARKFVPDAAYLNSPGKLTLGDAQSQRAALKVLDVEFTTAAEPIADDFVLGEELPGEKFLYAVITNSVSLGAATLAFGIEGALSKFIDAATYVPTNTPALKGKTGVAKATAKKLILATVAAAALPVGSVVKATLFFSKT